MIIYMAGSLYYMRLDIELKDGAQIFLSDGNCQKCGVDRGNVASLPHEKPTVMETTKKRNCHKKCRTGQINGAMITVHGKTTGVTMENGADDGKF